jgi:hypothetical protein
VVLGEEAVEAPQQGVEQLVVAAVGGHDPEGPTGERGQRGVLDPPPDDLLQRPVDLLVPDQVGRRHRGVGGVAGKPGGVVGLGQPAGQAGHDPGGPDPVGDDLGGQEAGLDEVPQRLAELVLAGGDDRGVGDRDAERVAEQGGHGEPVGQAADHGCLDGGLGVADPGGVAAPQLDDDEQGAHRHQQPGGPAPHPGEPGPALAHVGRLGGAAGRPGRRGSDRGPGGRVDRCHDAGVPHRR